ncbi:MAG: hypothetical protein B9S32_09500 [Verrucomicrobia bacterium Tous-C9LFEB]|nr:MAG: hypothetical protein B9S32_09500 [Verrucomicrobia bacterium Tous-C9LFEB]
MASSDGSGGLNRNQSFDSRYNMKVGPVLMNVTGGMSFSYNDNINLSDTNKKSDFIITPRVDITNHWPLTSLNSADLNVGLGYSKYLNNSSADSSFVNVSPGSNLTFVVYMGDFKFTFTDGFYFQQDPVSEIGLANVTTFGRISNTASANVDWDLNDVILSLGYSHTNFIATSAAFDYVDSSTDTVTQRTSFTITPTLTAGLSNSISFTSYDQDFLNNNWTLMSGPFASMQLSPYVSVSATTGVQLLNASTGGQVGDTTGNEISWYGSLSVTHRINNYMNQTLSLSQSNPTGLNSNFVGLTSLQHSFSWQLIRDVSLGTTEFVEYGSDSGGSLAENVWRYGGSVNLGYNLTQKLSLSLTYTLTMRESNAVDRNYTQNVLTLGANYAF